MKMSPILFFVMLFFLGINSQTTLVNTDIDLYDSSNDFDCTFTFAQFQQLNNPVSIQVVVGVSDVVYGVGKNSNGRPVLIRFDLTNSEILCKDDFLDFGTEAAYGLLFDDVNSKLYTVFTQTQAKPLVTNVDYGDSITGGWLTTFGVGDFTTITFLAQVDPFTLDIVGGTYIRGRVPSGTINAEAIVRSMSYDNVLDVLQVEVASGFSPLTTNREPMSCTGSAPKTWVLEFSATNPLANFDFPLTNCAEECTGDFCEPAASTSTTPALGQITTQSATPTRGASINPIGGETSDSPTNTPTSSSTPSSTPSTTITSSIAPTSIPTALLQTTSPTPSQTIPTILPTLSSSVTPPPAPKVPFGDAGILIIQLDPLAGDKSIIPQEELNLVIASFLAINIDSIIVLHISLREASVMICDNDRDIPDLITAINSDPQDPFFAGTILDGATVIHTVLDVPCEVGQNVLPPSISISVGQIDSPSTISTVNFAVFGDRTGFAASLQPSLFFAITLICTVTLLLIFK
eukprot:TRINITY_DN49_c5_g1_i2.p1 TRINITY_DN49_c5_g1~~TRINITY_DN49_c5_g1_i2.p1  ORF type:complete len:518 (+),score=180.46 TRINITY_DN49_c5_g1_i2:105-1658(+)